ncbi:MAG: ABC transporter substrate-binding protein [Patescibacteria group bacterium]|nr:ABC transporter substrate-binding protein [Patescibacteria group bacterium]
MAVIIGASGWLGLTRARYATVQAVSGGVHIEGLIGAPNYINPVLAGTNQVDKTLVRFIYSGLTQISPTREVLPDLAESWEIFDEGKTYVFHLRNNVTWHDGVDFTADDVVYTINVLQNENFQGVLRGAVTGVAVEKIDDYTVKFTLPSPSAFFLYDIATGIVPKHILESIPVSDFQSAYQLEQVVGTGPFMIDKASDVTSIALKRFSGYYGKAPFIDRLVFFFFDTEKSMLASLKNRTISAAGFSQLGPSDVGHLPGVDEFVYNLPQYKGLFFNQAGGNNAIRNQAVRQALAYATNKQLIVDEVEGGWADIANSPILPGFWGHKPDLATYDFSIAKAAEVLKKDGWVDVDKDGVLEKDDTRLQFTLTIRNDEKSVSTAELLSSSWTAIGAEVLVEPLDSQTLIKDAIRPRAYDVLLFGQDLGADSDPYVYWHSSQTVDPGLALAVTFDKDLDNNLEAARTTTVLNKTITYYHQFQTAFAQTVPAILLYQPRYLYLVDTKVKGVTDQINLATPVDRFANISDWYIKIKKELE